MNFNQQDINDIKSQAIAIIKLLNYKDMWEEFWRDVDIYTRDTEDIETYTIEIKQLKIQLEYKYQKYLH